MIKEVIKKTFVSVEQHEFINHTAKFPAFIGGYGSGKTEALILRLLRKKFEHPKLNVAFYLPTYTLIRDIGYERIAEKLISAEIGYTLNRYEHVFHLTGAGKIILRSFDRPEWIIGYEVADSFADELDTLSLAKAAICWERIVARNRSKKPDKELNTIAVATTPEGFKFVYKKWGNKPAKGYEMVQGSTESNKDNLSHDYIEQLTSAIPENRIAAYIYGKFINITSGIVYTEFDRYLHGSTQTIRKTPMEELHIGIDFNVDKMAAVIHVMRQGAAHAVNEFTSLRDTPDMIGKIQSVYPGHPISVYPDASSAARKTVNASTSDLQLLRASGFKVITNRSNPFIRDRILRFNVALKNKRYFVNFKKCPDLLTSLEQHCYDDNGTPEKKSGLDHIIDAAGYFVSKRYPIITKTLIRGKF